MAEPRYERYSVIDFVEKLLVPAIKSGIVFTEVHVHGTWKPTIQQFREYKAKYGGYEAGKRLVESMRRTHTQSRGFADIAQHATIDPDGYVWSGRLLDRPPASATNYNDSDPDNRHPFMFEMIGNFDKGQEKLEGPQLEASVGLTKAILHHMKADLSAIRFHREFTNLKTCPGSGVDKSWFVSLVSKAVVPEKAVPQKEVVKVGMELPNYAWNDIKAFIQEAIDDEILLDSAWLAKVENKSLTAAELSYLHLVIDRRRKN